MLEIFNHISSNLDIINATNNSIIIPLFLIAIFVISFSVLFLKCAETFIQYILALCLIVFVCFIGVLATETSLNSKANDIIYEKAQKMCYTPMDTAKTTITNEELQTLTEYQLFYRALNYYSIAFSTLEKHVYKNIKNTENLKPTKDMNMTYSILLKNLEQIEKEMVYRHRHCLKNVCPEAYYPQNNYHSMHGPLDNFQKLKELTCK